MDLWIRSQEGVLGKPLFIRPAGLSLHIKWEGDFETFEHYESKQRALKVLDEIQDCMLKGSFAKKVNGLGEEIDLIPNPIFVYEMPID